MTFAKGMASYITSRNNNLKKQQSIKVVGQKVKLMKIVNLMIKKLSSSIFS